jgi:hypothetical protein
MKKSPRVKSKETQPIPTGIPEIDRLSETPDCTIHDYVAGVSTYVRGSSNLDSGPKKAAQIRLSSALARALANELSKELPKLKNRLATHEQKVAGGLRTANADVSESHPLDGLRLAVELKPINLAVGRAIWNRFGDIRTFAVNIHLKFPFAVVGGVLVIPIYEEVGTTAARRAAVAEVVAAEGSASTLIEQDQDSGTDDTVQSGVAAPSRRSTVHLIKRAIERLVRAGGRKSEADAAHLLEGIAVVVYDTETGKVDGTLPEAGSGLRWEEFTASLAATYRARFED